MSYEIHTGNCLDVMRAMPDCSVDSIVTDPPYGLSFMGKRWDYDVPSVEIWQECLRVLKPGGHLLAFAGTRTQHRMAVRIEDAGFEIRDMIAWVYGSGFPKSLDVSKAMDKRGGSVASFAEFRDAVRLAMKYSGVTRSKLQAALGNHMLSHYLTTGFQPAIPNVRDYKIIRDAVGLGNAWDQLFLEEAKREVVGQKSAGIHNPDDENRHTIGGSGSVTVNITAPATEAARQWHGWGTALKPALEPITVARKPLIGTVAENVMQYGTGGVNVDGCRVGNECIKTCGGKQGGNAYGDWAQRIDAYHTGRWPANFIHDGSDEAINLLASAARFFYCAKASKRDRDEGCEELPLVKSGAMSGAETRAGKPTNNPMRTNHHPTVKPTDLMRYLCRLVTPPQGTVLDPFMGSGSTGKAAALEGFDFIGIEMSDEYVEIARRRIEHAKLKGTRYAKPAESEKLFQGL